MKKFRNHPDLISALNEIGAVALVAIFRTHQGFVDWLGPEPKTSMENILDGIMKVVVKDARERTEFVDQIVLNHLSLLHADQIRSVDDIRRALFAASADVARIKGVSQTLIDCGQFHIILYVQALHDLDSGDAFAADQVRSRFVDWEQLRTVSREIEEKDPDHIAEKAAAADRFAAWLSEERAKIESMAGVDRLAAWLREERSKQN